MNLQAQTRVVDELIAGDEREVAAIVVQMREAGSDAEGAHVEEQMRVVDGLEEKLMLLGQGLEGLRLKHDSLVDRATPARELSFI